LLTFQLVVGVGTRVQDHLEEYVQAGNELYHHNKLTNRPYTNGTKFMTERM
jgi:hypothetical protein